MVLARALIGEGGSGAPPLVYSRALAYDASGGVLATTPRDTTPFDAIANPVATPVNLDQGAAEVDFDAQKAQLAALVAAVESAGYHAELSR